MLPDSGSSVVIARPARLRAGRNYVKRRITLCSAPRKWPIVTRSPSWLVCLESPVAVLGFCGSAVAQARELHHISSITRDFTRNKWRYRDWILRDCRTQENNWGGNLGERFLLLYLIAPYISPLVNVIRGETQHPQWERNNWDESEGARQRVLCIWELMAGVSERGGVVLVVSILARRKSPWVKKWSGLVWSGVFKLGW
jgi:hypothetical protein